MKLALSAFLVLFGGAASATAGQILYDLSFTATAGPTPTGSFLYDADAATDPFSNFLVTYSGQVLDLTGFANNPVVGNCNPSSLAAPGHDTFAALFSGTTPCGGPLGYSVALTAFNMGDDGSSDQQFLLIQAMPSGGFLPSGGGTFTATAAVPEPGTLGLLLGGGAVLALWRRRNRQGPEANGVSSGQARRGLPNP